MSAGKKLVIAACGFLLVALLWLGSRWMTMVPRSAADALREFHAAGDVAESQLMDPLILAGEEVVPLLVEKLREPHFPRRRYAIGALGHIGDRRGLPALKSLALDPEQQSYIRCDALEATALIDVQVAKELATRMENASGKCFEVAQASILSGGGDRRTFWRIILGGLYVDW
jgi:HEAT repeat protein